MFLPYADKLPSLKWAQVTWAGVEKLVPNLQDKQINYVVTRFSSKAFGLAMSEYVIANIFNFERNQREQYKNQAQRQWITSGKILSHRLICDLSVGVLGLGNIGKSSKYILYFSFSTAVENINLNIKKYTVNFYSCTKLESIWSHCMGNDTDTTERNFTLP